MADLIQTIDEEIRDLEASLAADPRQMKLKALRELRALYTSTSMASDVSAAAAPKVRGNLTIRRRIHPDRIRLLNDVQTILELSIGPVKTADIFDLLDPKNRDSIGGTDPRNNLSAIIHNSGRFFSHGRRGWSLKPPEPGEEQEVEDAVE